MRIRLEVAAAGDAAELVKLRTAINQRFLSRHGKGYWIANTTERGVLFRMRQGTVFVARASGKIAAALTLSTRKPWAIDTKYFSAVKLPLYLTGMEVSPDLQGKGVGSQCLQEACRLTREWPADAIRLDAYAETAGAGEFYRKCGFREVGRATYRKTQLIYFEMLII